MSSPNGQWTGVGVIRGPAGPTGPQGDQGPTGPTGPQGNPGAPGTNGSNGAPGAAAGFGTPTATGLAAGAAPTVSRSGPDTAAIFAFGIPAGAAGAPGSNGATGPPGLATGANPPAGGNPPLWLRPGGLPSSTAAVLRAPPAVYVSPSAVTSYSFPKQDGTVAGDTILALVMGSPTTGAIAGFAAVNGTGVGPYTQLFSRVADGTEGATFTITGIPASRFPAVAVVTLAGAARSPANNGPLDAGPATSWSAPSITPAAPAALIWMSVHQNGWTGASFNVTAPPGFTMQAHSAIASNRPMACVALGDAFAPAAATGAVAGAGGGSAYGGAVLIGAIPVPVPVLSLWNGSAWTDTALAGPPGPSGPAGPPGPASDPIPSVVVRAWTPSTAWPSPALGTANTALMQVKFDLQPNRLYRAVVRPCSFIPSAATQLVMQIRTTTDNTIPTTATLINRQGVQYMPTASQNYMSPLMEYLFSETTARTARVLLTGNVQAGTGQFQPPAGGLELRVEDTGPTNGVNNAMTGTLIGSGTSGVS